MLMTRTKSVLLPLNAPKRICRLGCVRTHWEAHSSPQTPTSITGEGREKDGKGKRKGEGKKEEWGKEREKGAVPHLSQLIVAHVS